MTTSVLSMTRYTVCATRTVVSSLLNRLNRSRLTAYGVRTVNGGGAADRAVLRFRRRRCLLRRTGRCRHRLIAERSRSWPIVVGLSRFHDVSTHARTHAESTRMCATVCRLSFAAGTTTRYEMVPLCSLRLTTPSQRSYPVPPYFLRKKNAFQEFLLLLVSHCRLRLCHNLY